MVYYRAQIQKQMPSDKIRWQQRRRVLWIRNWKLYEDALKGNVDGYHKDCDADYRNNPIDIFSSRST